MTNKNLELKLNMINFLMHNFELLSKEKNGVEIFKANVDDLVNRNQIPYSVRDIVFEIYGIVNTNSYSPSRNEEKLYQITMSMETYKMITREKFINHFKKGVKAGQFSKTASDIIRKIFEIDDLNVLEDKKISNIPMSTYVPKQSNHQKNPLDNLRKPTEPKIEKSIAVKKDIGKFKKEYLNEIYYEYPNPSFDGCSGSQRYLYTKLIDAINRPNDATFKIYYKISDDGCHSSYAYMDVPEAYKKEEPKPMSSSVGCSSGGGYNFGRSC